MHEQPIGPQVPLYLIKGVSLHIHRKSFQLQRLYKVLCFFFNSIWKQLVEYKPALCWSQHWLLRFLGFEWSWPQLTETTPSLAGPSQLSIVHTALCWYKRQIYIVDGNCEVLIYYTTSFDLMSLYVRRKFATDQVSSLTCTFADLGHRPNLLPAL